MKAATFIVVTLFCWGVLFGICLLAFRLCGLDRGGLVEAVGISAIMMLSCLDLIHKTVYWGGRR